MFIKIPKGRPFENAMIGQSIRHYRRMKDISQKSLAEKVKVNLSFISRVERGVDMPNLKLLFKIAKALQVKTRDLIPPEL